MTDLDLVAVYRVVFLLSGVVVLASLVRGSGVLRRRRGRAPDGPTWPQPAPAPVPQAARAPTVPVTVPPLGDGRPGEMFLAPAPPDPHAGGENEHGARSDALVRFGDERVLTVVCHGRVGAVTRGDLVEAAPDRPVLGRAVLGTTGQFVGGIASAETAAGPAWRTTFVYQGVEVTDVHVDRDGWAFVVGVARRPGDTGAESLLDEVLATWAWLPGGDDVTAVPPPALPADPGRADVALDVLTPDGALVADCWVPAPPTATQVRGADGTWTHLYVRVARGAALVVTSAPVDPARGPRDALEDPDQAHDSVPVRPAGPLTTRSTAAGDALVRTFAVGEGVLRTEVRLERDGRSWAWGLVRLTDDPTPVVALDSLLASWRWR